MAFHEYSDQGSSHSHAKDPCRALATAVMEIDALTKP